jgi:hypothetical protein
VACCDVQLSAYGRHANEAGLCGQSVASRLLDETDVIMFNYRVFESLFIGSRFVLQVLWLEKREVHQKIKCWTYRSHCALSGFS